MLTRRSFLTGLITAPAIVAACNIMKVRPVEGFLGYLGGYEQWERVDDVLSITHVEAMAQVMKEANIPAFSLNGISGLHYSAYVSQDSIEEGRRRFRAANQHYGCDVTPQMAMDFL